MMGKSHATVLPLDILLLKYKIDSKMRITVAYTLTFYDIACS